MGQQALYYAVQNDQAFDDRVEERAQVPVPTETDEITAGPVKFSIAASYSIEFNDNVNLTSEDPQGDLIQLFQATLGLSAPISEKSYLSFSVGIGYRLYAEQSDLSGLYISPGTAVAWDIQAQDVFITLYDNFSYSPPVTSQPGLSDQAEFNLFENTIGARATWAPSQVVLSAGYGYQINFSDGSDLSYLDGNTHLIFGRAGYLFTPEIDAGVEVSGTLADYNQDINPDSTVVSVGPYFEWRPLEVLRFGIRGGPSFYDSQASVSQPARSGTSYYFGLNASHQLTQHISHSLDLTHGLSSGVQAGSSLTEQSAVDYIVSWAFRDPAVASLGLSYNHGDQTLVGSTDETYDQYGFNLGLSYAFFSKLSCQLGYSFYRRDSNLSTGDYTQNSVTLGATYRFR
jgi:opacity protein-like surface antigen